MFVYHNFQSLDVNDVFALVVNFINLDWQPKQIQKHSCHFQISNNFFQYLMEIYYIMCLSSFDEKSINLIMFFNMNISYKNNLT
jgi:hypothetical protein